MVNLMSTLDQASLLIICTSFIGLRELVENQLPAWGRLVVMMVGRCLSLGSILILH